MKECGVPQGCELFTIHINSLLLLNTTRNLLSYADDTIVIYDDISCSNLKQKTEKDVTKIFNWFAHKQSTVNAEKTN